MQSLFILGRQPEIGIAELESLYGSDKLRVVANRAVIVGIDSSLVSFDRLGASVKFGKVLSTLPTSDWGKVEQSLIKTLPDEAKLVPEGKLRLGLSIINVDVNLQRAEITGLKIKKAIQKTGRSVRVIPNNNNPDLNSAQVIHNKLTGSNGWELLFIKDGQQTIIAQTVKVQDINSYASRDQQRPKRDAKVGMLPPKLAQTIVNLAAGLIAESALEVSNDFREANIDQTVLDPFCGSGVILQEARLMGYKAYGTDLEPRMVKYSQDNMTWLSDKFNVDDSKYQLATGDATTFNWGSNIDFVASETYLGRPFTSHPTPEILEQTIHECNLITKKFLKNIHTQLASSQRLCLAIPAWQVSPGVFKKLPLIDQLDDLGYNLVSFKHTEHQELIYYRSDQVVARYLLVITRK